MGAYFTISGEFITRTKATKRGTQDAVVNCFDEVWLRCNLDRYVSVERHGKYRQKATIEMDYVTIRHSDADDIMRGWLKCCEMIMDQKDMAKASARYSGDEGDTEYTLRAGKRYLVLNSRIDVLNGKIKELEKERDKLVKERSVTHVDEFHGSIVDDEDETEMEMTDGE